MSDEEIESLLGPYVIGALDAHDERRVERYLADHGEAALEVSRMTEAFDDVLDAQAMAFEPRTDLWDQIARQLPDRAGTGDPVVSSSAPGRHDEGELDPGPSPIETGDVGSIAHRRPVHQRRAPAERRRLLLAAAAVVVVVMIGIGSVWAGRATHHQTPAEAAAQVVASGDSLQMTLRGDDGTPRGQVVMDDHGNAYVLPTDMPVLDQGRTYQLWAEEDGKMISLGLIGDGTAPAHLTVGTQPRALDLSAEPAGGSVAPTVRIAAGHLS